MIKKLKLLSFCILLFNFFSLYGLDAVYKSESYNLNVKYNNILVPGDAVFVKMSIILPKNHKKNKNDFEKKAVLQLYKDKKQLETAQFYQINKKRNQSNIEMLCGIPLSPWLTEGNFVLKVLFSFSEQDTKTFELPVIFKNRVFDSETIELDEKNTSIKTDNSPARTTQINKLNEILFTINPQNVYSLKRMSSPTTSTRYTAHFGDRRVYAYTNGKSSTSLHYGNDYGIPEGSDVRSCADGKVVMAENRISTGWSIVVEHLPGLYSLYYHLSEMNVSTGDMVKQGELIGKSGSTGLATGPHLHWEIRLNGSAIRPEFLLEDFAFDDIE